MSPKFEEINGFVFKIYSNEEKRMHIHVVKAENEAKYWLEPNIELAENFGFNTKELSFIEKILKDYETILKSNSQDTQVSVLMINDKGIMLSVKGNDYFISYNRIPWMKNACISDALDVQMSGRNAIEWPKLDVDLEIESLKHPERYPLIMKRNEMEVL